MGVYKKKKTHLGTAPKPAIQPSTIPASVGGVNAFNSLMAMPSEDCIYTYNLMPVEYGLRLRQGYREWATGLPGPVRTVMAFDSAVSDHGDDRLWAVCEDGIFDVSLYNTTTYGPPEVAFTVPGAGAGFGVFAEFTSLAAEHYLFYADELNGLHQYEESTQLWTSVFAGWTYDNTAEGGGATDPFPTADIAFVTVYKLRIWVILHDSSDAYYLPVASVGGTLEKFTFGAKMPHGGNLQGLWTWTVDGGNGVDDYLVGISRGGDLIAYQGTDPTDTSWQQVGSWFIGETPVARRLVAQHGAEVYVLSAYGITSLRDLLQGSSADNTQASPSAKVARFLRADLKSANESYEWALTLHPADGFMQIITPGASFSGVVQYNQNLSTKAWGFWSGVPIVSAFTLNSEYFMGTPDGRVLIYDGVTDDAHLPNPSIWTNFVNNFPGLEWTYPAAGTYVCDGTQVADSDVIFDASEPATINTMYTVTYVVNDSNGGGHSMGIGDGMSPVQYGDGAFSAQVPNTNDVSVNITLRAAAGSAGTFTNLAVSVTSSVGTPVPYQTLTSFQAPGGNHASYKLPGFIRVIGVLAGTTSLNTRAVFDYDVETVAPVPPSTNPTAGADTWNSAVWDTALWDYSVEGRSYPFGALGLGRTMAIASNGSASTRINVVGWDVLFQEGGLL